MSKFTRNKDEAKSESFLGKLSIYKKLKKVETVVREELQPGPCHDHVPEILQQPLLENHKAEVTDVPIYRQEHFKINHTVVEGTRKAANITSLQYQPLNKERNEFRILTILSESDGSDMVRCTMNTCSLDDPPPFYALSYVWGNPESTADIIVNDCAFSATVNLERALRALWMRLDGRSDCMFTTPDTKLKPPLFPSKLKIASELPLELRFPKSQPLRIWADAICINQADLKERLDQVLRMRHIYSKALATIGWLGPADQNSNDAFYMLHLLALESPEAKYREVIESDGHKFNAKFKDLWVAVAQILTREYWERSWILQEILLANQVWFVCGRASASLRVFIGAIYGARFRHEAALEQLGYLNDSGSVNYSAPGKMLKLCLKFEMVIWERENDAWKEREAAKQLHERAESPETAVENTPGSNFASSEYRLVNLLYERSLSRLKATHINDQIYSLLGLASDAEKLVPKPNYNTPFRIIMTEIYENLIRETQVLDWICLSGGNDSFDPKGKVAASPTLDLAEGKGKSSLQFQKTAKHYHFIQSERARGLWPSWVPDHQKPCGGDIPGRKRFYNLTKNHEPEIQINGSVLSCRGLIFDTIENPSSSENSEGGFPALAKGKSPASRTTNPYMTAAMTYEAIWQSTVLQAQWPSVVNHHPVNTVDTAWAFAEYWNGIFEGLPDDRELLYPPLSSFDAETLDTDACGRRWGLLHHQADLLIHGLPLREWVKRRTWNWTFGRQRLADDLGYEAGLGELLAPANGKVWDSAEEKPMLLRMIEFKADPIVGVFTDSIITDKRKEVPSYIVTMNTSVELYVTRKGYVGSRYRYYTQNKVGREDVVALLFGCSVPVILRPRKGADGYELIGATYIHGIMNGEAFEGSSMEDVQWINIH